MERISAANSAGWTWAQTAALIVPCVALLGAFLTYALNQRAARRESRARTFAEALSAVEDYLEMPYRVRRRPNTAEGRHSITNEVSAVLARMAFHQAWLQIVAPPVAGPYAALVATARSEAGAQMRMAWQQLPIASDREVNLGTAYPRHLSDAARASCLMAMRQHL